MFSDDGDDCRSDDGGNWVFDSRLNHAGSSSLCDRENAPKVEIVRKHDHGILARERHELRIQCFRISERGPVNAVYLVSGEEFDPRWREVDVNEDLHLEESGTSNSSERQAA